MEEENLEEIEETELSSGEQAEVDELADEFLESDEGQELLREFREEEIREEQEKILAQAKGEEQIKSEVLKIAQEKGISLPDAYKVYLETKISQEEKEKLKPQIEEINFLIKQLKENKGSAEESELKQKLVEKWLNL